MCSEPVAIPKETVIADNNVSGLSSTVQDALCFMINKEESIRIALLSPFATWHPGESYLNL